MAPPPPQDARIILSKLGGTKARITCFPGGAPSCPSPCDQRRRSRPGLEASARLRRSAAPRGPGTASRAGSRFQLPRSAGTCPRAVASWRGSRWARGARGSVAISFCAWREDRGGKAARRAWAQCGERAPGARGSLTCRASVPRPGASGLALGFPGPRAPSRPRLPRSGIPSSPGPALSRMERIGGGAEGGRGRKVPAGRGRSGGQPSGARHPPAPRLYLRPGPRTNRRRPRRREEEEEEEAPIGARAPFGAAWSWPGRG